MSMETGKVQFSELQNRQVFYFRSHWYVRGPKGRIGFKDLFGLGEYTKQVGFLSTTRVHAINLIHWGALPTPRLTRSAAA